MIFTSYNRGCLNCLHTSGVRHFSTFAKPIVETKSNIATWEFCACWQIKKTLLDAEIECEFCSYIGTFDVWDVEIDYKRIYHQPEQGLPWTKFHINKINNEVEIKSESIELGSNSIFLTFYNLLFQVLHSIPSRVFIQKDNGFLEASVFYIYESDSAMINLFRHSGLSKEDIILALELHKKNFKLDAGVFW